MDIEYIITIIIAIAPSLTAIIGSIISTLKNVKFSKESSQEVINKFEETRKAVMDTKEYESLKNELQIAHEENRQLKKLLKQYLTSIDRISRGNSDEQN